MSFKSIEVRIQNGVAFVSLARPESANTIDVDMAQELLAAATLCDGNPDVRAVLLTAQGRFFSGGGDVKSFAAAGNDAAVLMRRIMAPLHSAVSLFARMDAPLVTAVNGTAAGAGFSLAISGDIVMAAASARLTPAYTKIGMSADGGGSYFLPRLVGLKKAQELMLLNPLLTAEEAWRCGIVTSVVPDAELLSLATATARTLAEGPTRAHGEVKRLLSDAYGHSLETQLALELRSMTGLASGSMDAQEGFAAFASKRAARFTGR